MKTPLLVLVPIILLSVWLILILLGKGGFVHVLLLNGIAIAVIKIVKTYRNRATE